MVYQSPEPSVNVICDQAGISTPGASGKYTSLLMTLPDIPDVLATTSALVPSAFALVKFACAASMGMATEAMA